MTPGAGGRVPLTVCTYNIHACVGIDGLHDPARIVAVLDEIGADIVGLQEVDEIERRGGTRQFEYFATVPGFHHVAGPTRHGNGGRFGNMLLSRWPIVGSELVDLTLPGRHPRGAIDARLDVGGRMLRVIVAHLGLLPDEQFRQVRALSRRVRGDTRGDGLGETLRAGLRRSLSEDRGHRRDDEGDDPPAGDANGEAVLVMGDFNVWGPARPLFRQLGARGRRRTALPSFPAWAPRIALDRVWALPTDLIADRRIHRSALSRKASDHLPVVARVEFGPATDAADEPVPRSSRRTPLAHRLRRHLKP